MCVSCHNYEINLIKESVKNLLARKKTARLVNSERSVLHYSKNIAIEVSKLKKEYDGLSELGDFQDI